MLRHGADDGAGTVARLQDPTPGKLLKLNMKFAMVSFANATQLSLNK